MLTSFQVETVGYIADGAVYCPDCAVDNGADATLNRLDRYSAEEWADENGEYSEAGEVIVPGVLTCDECSRVIAGDEEAD